MPNEELLQRSYLASGNLRGDPFGDFESFNLGSTTIAELLRAGVHATVPAKVEFGFTSYRPPKSSRSAKPDRLICARQDGRLLPVAVSEHKAATKLSDHAATLRASEQALFSAASLGAPIAIVTNGRKHLYVDVNASMSEGAIVYYDDDRDANPAVIANLLLGDTGVAKDPKPLAESVWQLIWMATKEEPKACLLTFVELFVLTRQRYPGSGSGDARLA